jgi:prolyl-tRNA synthetase
MWPPALAPYQVHMMTLPGKGDTAADVVAAADALYEQLQAVGVEVLYDDRDASPGVKFADADLLGMPVRVTVGAKGLARGIVERRDRRTGEQAELPLAEAAAALANGS